MNIVEIPLTSDTLVWTWKMPFAVPHSDVDHAGIVFYSRVFQWAHIAYEEWYAAVVGEPFPHIFTQRGFGTPVVSTHAEYRRPIKHGQRLTMDIHCARLGSKSFTLAYEIKNADGVLCCTVWVTHATISFPGFKPMVVPDVLRNVLTVPA